MWLHFKGLYLEKENKVLRATHLLINICGNTLLGVLLFPQNWSKRFSKYHGGNPEIIEKVCEAQASVQTHLLCSHSGNLIGNFRLAHTWGVPCRNLLFGEYAALIFFPTLTIFLSVGDRWPLWGKTSRLSSHRQPGDRERSWCGPETQMALGAESLERCGWSLSSVHTYGLVTHTVYSWN